MLTSHEGMQAANQALQALLELTQLEQKTKIYPQDGQHIASQIKKYKLAWDIAYAAVAGARPKFHYSLYLQEQIQKWGRHIDCFVGERKHRVFKSIVAPRLSRLDFFTRSTLLQMTEIELTTSHSESECTGQLLGKQTQDWMLAEELGVHSNLLRRVLTRYLRPNVSYVLHRNSAWPFPCKLFLCRGANIATFPDKEIHSQMETPTGPKRNSACIKTDAHRTNAFAT